MEYYKNNIEKFTNFELLKEITNIGVWAGGSVICTFTNDIENISDIDIFTDTPRKGYQILDIIKKYDNNVVFKSLYGYKTSSIVNCSIKNSKEIQIIIKKYKNWYDIIEGFDFDYIQCGFHNDELYFSKNFRDSYKNKKIKYFITNLSSYRCLKAARKGFKTKVFNLNGRPMYPESWEKVKNFKFSNRALYYKNSGIMYDMDLVKFEKIDGTHIILDCDGVKFNASNILIKIENKINNNVLNFIRNDYILFAKSDKLNVILDKNSINFNELLKRKYFIVKAYFDNMLSILEYIVDDKYENELIPLLTF